MSNILLAWEFGENWGHLTRDLPVLRRLLASGHQILCAVNDTRMATQILGPVGISFVQSPICRHNARATQPLASYAEMLIASGYGEQDVLHGLICGWLGLYDLFRPDVVIIDYAPTALLAARIQDIPTVLFGSGFDLPPPSSPMPSFRVAEKIPIERLLLAEDIVLRNINHILASFHVHPLSQCADIFQGKHKILATFPELDHYGPRSGQIYVGPIYDIPQANVAQWHKESGEARIFAYLRPWMPGVEELLLALQSIGANVICVFPGAHLSLTQRFKTPLMQIFSTPVSIGPLLSSSDLVIGYSSGLFASALLAGAPLLLIPRWTEQYLAAQRVIALGTGLMAQGKPTQIAYSSIINTLLQPRFRVAAKCFAEKYASFDNEAAIIRIVDIIQGVAAQGVTH